MDTLLVLSAAILVGNKYRLERKMINEKNQSLIIDKEEEQMDTPVPNVTDEVTQLGISNNVTSGGLPHVPANSSVKVASQYTTDAVEEEKDSNENRFLDQFYPQNTAETGHTVSKKPWMLAVDSAYPKPREERVADFPTRDDRDDFLNKNMDQKIRAHGHLQTKNTIHISKDKNHERAVEPEWTATGEGRGFHPVKRYHQTPPSTGVLLDLPDAPKGSFSGASKPSQFTATENRRKGREVDHMGTAVAPVFKVPFKGSIEVEPSNAEDYVLEKHHNVGAYLPFKPSFNVDNSFTVAHDETVDTFDNDIMIGKTRTKSLNPRSKTQKNTGDTTSKDSQIETPVVVGALGGTRLKSIFKDSELKTSGHSENLVKSAAQLSLGTGGASHKKQPKLLIPDGIEQPEETLAETDDFKTNKNLRQTNSLLKKPVNTSSEMTTNDNKETIVEKDFTSKNFVAPVSKQSKLPEALLKKPTASMSSVNVELKEDKDLVKPDITRSKKVSNIAKPRDTIKPDITFKFPTVLENRLGESSRKPGRNPYLKREIPSMEL